VALNRLGLGMVFTARDLASGTMGRLERRFRSLDSRVTGGAARIDGAFRRMALGLAVFTAGAATMAGGVALAAAAGRFEQGIAAVGAVSRASATDLAALRQAAIQAGVDTQFSPDEAVAGLTALATAGQRATAATQTLQPVLDLAAGSMGQLGVDGAANAVVGTLNAYSLSAREASGVTDRLLRITQLTNFQARDFEVGLSRAAATGAQFGQSMDDVLLTLGLLRNRNIDASTSGTAVRESIRRIASVPGAQRALAGIVDIFDQDTGRMRSIIDIMQDFGEATADMSERERNRRLNAAFGARGQAAFTAVMTASYETMRNGVPVMLRGAAAIAAMRGELASSEGTAREFRRQLLNTFAGQATLLRGTLQTLAVVLGEPFAQVFRPIVGTVVDVLNGLLQAIQHIPAPIRRALAGIAVVAGGILTVVGGALAAEAGISLLVMGIEALGGSLLAVIVPLAAAAAAVAALAGLVAGFAVAFRENLGGLGDFVERIASQVRLFFDGLGQLFEQGGFSGAVRDDLNRAENAGVRQFLVQLFQLGFRAQRLWEGFNKGFVAALHEAEPVFKELRVAFEELGAELGEVFGGFTDGAANIPSERFVAFGARVARALASVIVWFARAFRIAAQFTRGLIQGTRRTWQVARPAMKALGETLRGLGRALGGLIAAFRGSEDSGRQMSISWEDVGRMLAFAGTQIVFVLEVLRGMAERATFVVRVVTPIVRAVLAVHRAMVSVATAIARFFFRTIPEAAVHAAGAIRNALQSIRSTVAPFASMLGIELPAGAGEGGATPRRSAGLLDASGGRRPDAALLGGAIGVLPAAADARRQASDGGRLEAAIAAMTEVARRAAPAPIQIALQVDAETLAQVTHNANRDVAARSFSPVPSY